MQKILFVCLGNICRSPLAEGIMLKINEQERLGYEIDSAGTANYHIGEAPDPRTISNALTHGIDLSPLRARQFAFSDFDYFDHIYVMDHKNLKDVLQMAKLPEHQKKVDLLLNTLYPGTNKEVPDPYYGTSQDFEDLFQLVNRICLNLADHLKGQP